MKEKEDFIGFLSKVTVVPKHHLFHPTGMAVTHGVLELFAPPEEEPYGMLFMHELGHVWQEAEYGFDAMKTIIQGSQAQNIACERQAWAFALKAYRKHKVPLPIGWRQVLNRCLGSYRDPKALRRRGGLQ